MLGVRLSEEADAKLTSYAREIGRPKSAIVKQWINERLERESIDELIRNAAALDTEDRTRVVRQGYDDASDAWLRALDAEDGGYDWGPEGPPL